MKKNIAIITGGDSSEEVISVKSATLIMDSVDTEKYNAILVHMKNGKWEVKGYEGFDSVPIDKNDFSFTVDSKKHMFDCAYLIIHGAPAENGKLQAYLDMLGIPYVGPRVLEASLTFNKEVCKQYLGLIGIKSAKARLIKKGDTPDLQRIVSEIGFPCFVKPNEAGSSFGVTKVKQMDQLEKALKGALTEDSSVMIERYIEGTEVTCGVYKHNGKVNVLPITEIISTKEFFDFEAKYTPGAADEITPARISPELTARCHELTGNIYSFLDLTGISRIDYIIENDEFYLLEVNTIPGMSRESIVPKQLRAAGYNLKKVITGLIDEEIGA
jgi:D-alanine-D-alanine ligase